MMVMTIYIVKDIFVSVQYKNIAVKISEKS
ncbi:hypothetical protein HmCmsJML277_01315 [Escherichia coli]|nr:hypothetical protein HmCmsJML277_01315 [Escherichia coli]